MKMLDGKFRVVCDNCNRKNVHIVFTQDGDLVMHCKAWGHTEIEYQKTGGL